MLGKVHIFNKKSQKVVKTIDFEDLTHNENLKINIRDNYLKNNSLSLVCGCNKNIEFGVDSLGRLYHKKKSDIANHNIYCNKHHDYKRNTEIQGWKEKEDSLKIISNLSFTDTSFEEKDTLDIDTFVKLLNIYSWNNYIYKNFSMPNNKYTFLKKIFGMCNLITLKNIDNKNLNSMYFNVKEYKQIKADEVRFVYMYLKKFDIDKEKNIVIITGEYDINKYFKFVVDRQLFTNKYMKLKKEGGLNSDLVVSGFVSKVNSKFIFKEFSIMRVNTKGLYCKNNNEIRLLNMLCVNNVLFIRPYKPIPLYNGKKPLAILIGNSDKSIFVDIFDSNLKEDLYKRASIIQQFDTYLKNTHNLIRWDVYDNKKLPSLKYINKLLYND